MGHVDDETLLRWLFRILKFQAQRSALALYFDFKIEIEILHDRIVTRNPIVKLQNEFITTCHKTIKLCLHEGEFLIGLFQYLVGVRSFNWTLSLYRSNLVHIVDLSQ